ncbi:hypothetical protein AGABI1DRAFT_110649 [Agaricus bisporus var. burnettii JB137-S8]|uniref:Glycoside hydrolase family 5 domain-containing protein n=2 Tax=Agaricus bisporus var. burnettii TaxID=192524 RepID=K5WAZ8_AGABU|nr:uncharacterized protein AGABI1DRAFT_110649 [Agaricus bisporus var. burnettii JB137-S8]EKM84059.1 hypothetical protein AGABI1DRAFT_110649 [Agaricus bisporus var. burnettii JB137-S8]KAF7784147.1 CAZyme family GH5 [Agaricus bisporus var. burnettii]
MAYSSGLHMLLMFLLGLSATRSVLGLTFGFPYGKEKVRGVNLGGWLVLEPWITPSLFDGTMDDRIVDEYTFGQYMDKEEGRRMLQRHWDSWITEKDFEAISRAGLNHVRLPIGFWAFDISGGEPYIQGQLAYMNKAFGWAAKHNLKVIVDLHGAPGSQNGFDNSGQKMDYPQWHTDMDNVSRTNAIIKRIASQVRDMTGVAPVIAPLNEPAGFYGEDVLSVTKQYWKDSYQSIRYPYTDGRKSNIIVMIHDAFQPLSYWQNFMPAPQYEGVILDTHIYQVFSDEMNAWSEQKHIQETCNRASDIGASDLWTVVGEWSPASTDCARYLNGRFVGARYDGTKYHKRIPGRVCALKTGSGATFSPSYKKFLRQFWEAQTITYEKGQGWIQWTWKAEEADEWSYQAGLNYGWIPEDPNNRIYPDICG